MKTKQFLALMFFIGIFASCGKEKYPVSAPVSQKSEIDGDWNLILTEGGLTGNNENFELGEIIWNFSSLDSILTVENNSSSTVYYTLPSGTYDYVDVLENGNSTLTIGNIISGGYTIDADTLFLDAQPVMVDGFSSKFVR